MELNDLIVQNLESIKKDIKDIRKEINQINEFKWKILGMATTLSFVMSLAGGWIIKNIVKEKDEYRSIYRAPEHENEEGRH